MNHDRLRHPRVYNFDEQLAIYGDRFVELIDGLHRGDPLADEVISAMQKLSMKQKMELIDGALAGRFERTPDALQKMMEDARQVPSWVDWNRIERGAATLMRTGVIGGLTLGAKSLVEGYLAPAGNKPLALSGRLREQAAMRLNETARFVEAVASPEGMRPGNPGFDITLKVRLMHAGVRALIERSGQWQQDLWAIPINQHDMVATIHLFSTAFMEGVQTLGMEISPLEQEDFLHLWRYVGHVIGVDSHLLPRAMREAHAQWSIISATQGDPDDDSRNLAMALLEGPLNEARTEEERVGALKHVAFAKGVCRRLIGDRRADQLGLPENRWSQMTPVVAGVIKTLDKSRRFSFVDPWLQKKGRDYWEHTIAIGAQGRTISFPLPEALAGRSSS